MKWATIPVGAWLALALLGGAVWPGCAPSGGEAWEVRDRHLRRARAAKDAQDVDRAIDLCEKALARKPDLALAHRELGLMLDNYRQDYLRALYHYRRYLELRPDSPYRADVEELARQCRASCVAQMEESSVELKRVLQARDERIRRLELEVAELRQQAAAAAAPRTPPPAESSAPPVPVPAAAPAAPAAQVHVVQAGETLGTISARYYGTPAQWTTIYRANRDRVADANNVRVGTRLDIPPQ